MNTVSQIVWVIRDANQSLPTTMEVAARTHSNIVKALQDVSGGVVVSYRLNGKTKTNPLGIWEQIVRQVVSETAAGQLDPAELAAKLSAGFTAPEPLRRTAMAYRELTDEERASYWYVDLPDDRPTSGKRITEEEWKARVDGFLDTRDDGTLYQPGGLGDDVPVPSDEWKRWLRSVALSERRRLFWEPLNSRGLTDEGRRLFGGMC